MLYQCGYNRSLIPTLPSTLPMHFKILYETLPVKSTRYVSPNFDSFNGLGDVLPLYVFY